MLRQSSGAWKGDGAEELRFLEQRGSRWQQEQFSPCLAPSCCRQGAEGAGLRGCRQPGDAGAGPEVLKGSEGRAEGGMLEVVAAVSASPVCDRAGVASLCETRFAGTMWLGWGWLGRNPSLAWGAECGCKECAWNLTWLSWRRVAVSCWKQRPWHPGKNSTGRDGREGSKGKEGERDDAGSDGTWGWR